MSGARPARRSLLLAAVLALSCGPTEPPAASPAPLPARVDTPADEGWAPVDTDGDGASDARDRCPTEAEDCDGFQDADGCPDLDNDADGVLDVCDACPGEPGPPGSLDGCPRRVVVARSHIQIVEYVYFPAGSARPEAASRNIFEALAKVLEENPEIGVVGCVGHAAAGERSPDSLSMSRGVAGCEELVRRGIARDRVVPQGAGVRDPLDADAASARNRRVSFVVVRMRGVETGVWNGRAYVPATPPQPVPVAPAPPGCSGQAEPPGPPPPPPGGCPGTRAGG
jgi:OmpA-OmpF porin, OOP family